MGCFLILDICYDMFDVCFLIDLTERLVEQTMESSWNCRCGEQENDSNNKMIRGPTKVSWCFHLQEPRYGDIPQITHSIDGS